MFTTEESTQGVTAKKLLFTLKYVILAGGGIPEEVVTEIKSAPKKDYPIILYAITQKFNDDDTKVKFNIMIATMTDKDFIEAFCRICQLDPATIEL